MGKSLLFGGITDLDNAMKDTSPAVEELDNQFYTELAEVTSDFYEAKMALENLLETNIRFEEDLASLEEIGSIVKEHGMSESMQVFIGESLEAIGISLPSVTEDNVSEVGELAAEGIGDKLKEWKDKAVEFIKKIVAYIKNFIKSLFDRTHKLRTVLVKMLKDGKLSKEAVAKVDAKAFGEIKVTGFSKGVVDNMAKASSDIMDLFAKMQPSKPTTALDTAVKSLKTPLGLIGYSISEEGVISKDKDAKDFEKKDEVVSKLGYTKASDVVDQAKSILNILSNLDKNKAGIEKAANETVKAAEHSVKAVEAASKNPEEVKEAQKEFKALQKIAALQSKCLAIAGTSACAAADQVIKIANKMK